jgi:hypothetical protein
MSSSCEKMSRSFASQLSGTHLRRLRNYAFRRHVVSSRDVLL